MSLDRRGAGILRVQWALEHVETAQRELSRAQQELCAVIGYAPEGARLRKLHDRVKAEWYRLQRKLDRPARGHVAELDHEVMDADHEPHRQGCGRVGWRGPA